MLLRSTTFLKDTILYWHRNHAARLSAALTYYAMASLTPMLVLLIAIAGLFFTPDRAAVLLTGPVSVAIGAENTSILQRVIENAYDPPSNLTAGIISVLILIVTGSELFRQVSFTLNSFWQTPKKKSDLPAVRKVLKVIGNHILYRVRAFTLVLGTGLVMLGTLLLSAGLGIAENMLGNMVDIPYAVLAWTNRAFSAFSAFIFFGLVFRYVPKLNMAWKAIWSGALVSTILFNLLQHLFSFYIATRSLGSAFGAAGSLVVMLFWVYYSIQGLLFGAAWTKVMHERITSQENPA